jgi:RNA-binding protein YlmH
MKGEVKKFAVISEMYLHFTEKNKEKLIKTAENLLKVQKEDAVMLTDALTPRNEHPKSAHTRAQTRPACSGGGRVQKNINPQN